MRLVTKNGFVMCEGENVSSNCDFYMVDGLPVFEGFVNALDIVQLFDFSKHEHKVWVVRPSQKFMERWERENSLREAHLGHGNFERYLGNLSMEGGDAILVEDETAKVG